MPRKRSRPEKIIAELREADILLGQGGQVAEAVEALGVSEVTYHRWRLMDAARIGQEGRLCHRWWARGRRPPGRRDKRFESACLSAAVEPGTGAGVAPVPSEAAAVTMNLFLPEFGGRLPEGVRAALALDRTGWHGAKALAVPANVMLVHLPPYSLHLNLVEQVWLYLRERRLSLRVFADYRAIVDACCQAWNHRAADPDRLRSLCDQPWIRKVNS